MKDPIAVLSAPWLAITFDMYVVVLARHPGAFVYSILEAGWAHPFADFLAQPALMEHILSPFWTELESASARTAPLLEPACLLWIVIYHAVRENLKQSPDWLLVRPEDFSRPPTHGFKTLFDRLGLEFGLRTSADIKKTTGKDNPVAGDEGKHVIAGDSRSIVDQWKRELDEATIDLIKALIGEHSAWVYSEDDWLKSEMRSTSG